MLVQAAVLWVWELGALRGGQWVGLGIAVPWCDLAVLVNVHGQVTAWAVFHDEVDVLVGVDAVAQVDNVGVAHGLENRDLALQVLEELGRKFAADDRLDGYELMWHRRMVSSVHKSKGALSYLRVECIVAHLG